MIRVRKEAVVNVRDASGKITATNRYPYETFLIEPGETLDAEMMTEIDALASAVGAGKRADFALDEDGDVARDCTQAEAKADSANGIEIRTEGWRAALNNGLNLLFNAAAKPTSTTKVETKRSDALDAVLADPQQFALLKAAKLSGGMKGWNAFLERYWDENLAQPTTDKA